jgi:integrase
VATVYWRGKCAYLNWSEGGRQHRRSLGEISKYEAETRRTAKAIELRTGHVIFKASDLFGTAAVRYLEWHRIQFPASHKRIDFIVQQRLKDFHDRPLAAITQQEIERWLAARLESKKSFKDGSTEPLATETAAKELRTLKALLNKAVEWKLLTDNPAKHVYAPKTNESEPVHWYSAAELRRLYKTDPIHASSWQFMANTGLRRREAMQLRWTDVRDGSVWVVSRGESARTKSGLWRQVPLSTAARGALRKLKRGNKTVYVLPRMARESWSRAFATAVERARLDGSLHSLRHSFAANLVTAGVSLRVVQKLMGHASIKTTEQYAHLAETALQKAVAGLKL